MAVLGKVEFTCDDILFFVLKEICRYFFEK